MIDVRGPVTNPELKAALEGMHRENTRENQDKALDALLQAHLLSPVSIDPPPEGADGEGKTQLKKDTKIQFQLLSTQDNRVFFPAFTDWEELRKLCGPQNQQTLVLTFADYVPMVLRDAAAAGLVVNPFGDSLTLERPMVEYLAGRLGLLRQEVKKDTQVMLGQPAQWPEELVKALKERCAQLPEVSRLWLRLMVKEETRSYLLVVDHSGRHEEVFPRLAQAARPYLEGMPIDLTPWSEGFGRSAVQDVEPFYTRIS